MSTEKLLHIEKELLQSEADYFYANHHDKNRDIIQVNIVLGSIYDAAMNLELADEQKNILSLQGKDITDSLNGTVVLCKDIKRDGVHVIISQRPFYSIDNGTVFGTINHELTHANDFVDFANRIRTTESDLIMRNDYWHTLHMWSEFHARRNGFLRILKIAGGEATSFDDDFAIGEINLIREKWIELKDENELYELMQLCGRYSVIEELFSDKVSGFEKDLLEGVYSGIKLYICNQIYNFCKTHTSFDSFFEDKAVLKRLIT